MRLSLVVPCYNESENIPLLVKRFAEFITDDKVEVVLVDNGSTDNSFDIIDSLLKKYLFVRTISVPINQGYGYGIIQGLKTCQSDYIGWTHADMQTDPKDVMTAWRIIQDKNSNELFLKGKRIGRSLVDRFFTVGMSTFETIYLGKKMTDINAQPNIFPKKFFEQWKTPPYDFSLDLYAFYLAKIQKLKIIRFKVKFPKRMYGQSKWNTGFKSKWKFIKRTVIFSRKLKKAGIH